MISLIRAEIEHEQYHNEIDDHHDLILDLLEIEVEVVMEGYDD